ncbi:MAG: hypothetical protein DIU78_008570 [Pseudomonadota bacterium]|nr:MAG: hypothetical protein DIU78_07755 [Pseudomonadota bacterium]
MTAELSDASLLTLLDARFALPGESQLPPVSLSASGRRVVLVGAFGFLFRALVGEVRLAGGSATVLGTPLESAVAHGVVGVAFADPPLPPGFTLERYVRESAELLGMGARAARRAAGDLLARYELDRAASRRLESLSVVERRVLALVHATLAEPAVLFCETPLARLDDASAEYVETVLARVLAGRRAVISVADPSGRERALLDRADVVLVLDRHHGVARYAPGTLPAGGARVLATVIRRGAEFREALRARGLEPRAVAPVPALAGLFGAHAENPTRLTLELPAPDATGAVFEAAAEAEAPLVELVPLP